MSDIIVAFAANALFSPVSDAYYPVMRVPPGRHAVPPEILRGMREAARVEADLIESYRQVVKSDKFGGAPPDLVQRGEANLAAHIDEALKRRFATLTPRGKLTRAELRRRIERFERSPEIDPDMPFVD